MPGSILETEIHSDLKYQDVTIPSGASLSPAIDMKAHRLHHIILPASMDGGEIMAQVSAEGTNWFDLYNQSGTYKLVASAVAGASRCVIVALADLYGFQYLKLKTTTNVGADRIVKLGMVPR